MKRLLLLAALAVCVVAAAQNPQGSSDNTAAPAAATATVAPPITNPSPYTVVGTPFEIWRAGQQPPAGYTLRPGDILAITVWDAPEHTVPSTIVRPDGKIAHPFLGEIVAAGKTAEQLAEDLRKGLRKEIRNPNVAVTILGFRQEAFFVMGAVARPGMYPVSQPITLQQALAWAGDRTLLADRQRATLVAPDGKRTDFSPEEELKRPAGQETIKVSPGTILICHERPIQRFAILGAVQQPGIYDIPEKGRLADALALARGLAPDAAPESVRLTHEGGEPVTLDLNKIMANKNDPANELLQDGDAILVPPRSMVAVLGEVREPGVKQLVAGSKVSSALALAGGLNREGDERKARLMRADGSLVELDLRELLSGRKPELDIELKSGDALLVPPVDLSQVVIIGAVKMAGRYPMEPGSRVSHVIAKAGGLDGEIDRCLASLVHADGKTEDVDLVRILLDRDTNANPLLVDGDTVIVRSLATGFVTVLGAVNQAGRVPLAQVRRIADLLAVAQPAENAGDDAQLLCADGRTLKIDLAAVMSDKRSQANLELHEGDTLIVSSMTRKVAVLGAVKEPGRYLLRKGNRFSDALAAAGDMTELADRKRATILRLNGKTVTVNPAEAIAGGNQDANPLLEEDDTVIIGTAQMQVAVLGEVTQPNQYYLRPGDRFSDALAAAGGMATGARARTATVLRANGQKLSVDLDRVLNKTDAAANLVLEDRDTVVLEAGPRNEVVVLGAVTNPGLFELPPNSRVSDAVALGGGLSKDAEPRLTKVTREGAQVQAVDLQAIMEDASSPANLLLRHGDVVFVPEREISRVVVMGSVRLPGRHELDPGARVVNAIGKAGGLMYEADRSSAILMHPDGTTEAVDLEAAIDRREVAANLLMRDGDTLIVDSVAAGQVAALGAVSRSGRFPLSTVRYLSDLVATCQLSTEAGDSATLLRADGKTLDVNLDVLLSDKRSAQNVELRDGDTLYVNSFARRVAVLGGVKLPGRYTLRQGNRLSDALAAAQDLSEDADRHKAQILRADGRILVVDPSEAVAGEDLAANPVLQDGDTVVVERVRKLGVHVMGKVKQQGRFEVKTGTRLSQAIAVAGGIDPLADATRVAVVRGTETQNVDLSALLQGEQVPSDPLLQDGDLVLVPESTHMVTILGAVRKPGTYPFKPGDRVLDAVARSAEGWLTKDSAPGRSVLTRQIPEGRAWQVVNLTVASSRGDIKQNPELKDGDLIYVPDAKTGSVQKALSTIFPLASLINVLTN